MMDSTGSLAFVSRPLEHLESLVATRGERPGGSISRIVGVYQMVLRRTLEHFFPDAQLEVRGDRSIIDWDGSSDETYYRLENDPDGLGVDIDWLGTHLSFMPGNPVPYFPPSAGWSRWSWRRSTFASAACSIRNFRIVPTVFST
jgi:hypothetical protein